MKEKKHTIIPNSIRIQLKDLNNKNLEIENVLCHLNIYIDSSSYYTFSFIPTNSIGKVILTKDEIIKNTGLQHCYDDKLVLDNSPVKFEFFIFDKELLNNFISSLRGYLNIKLESIKEDLRRRGFNESQIKNEIPKAIKVQKEDKILYDFLVQNKNAVLDYTEENTKIVGIWNDEKDYDYEIKIKTVANNGYDDHSWQ